MTFNLFGPPTKDDIRVGYIDPVLGLVEGVTICQANDYALKNPGTTFVFRNGNNVIQYLNINEVNSLDPNILTSTDECGGINQRRECGPPTIQLFGGGGIGAAGNPVIGRDGSLLAVDIVRGGNGYQYPPLVAARDNCNYGSGATLIAVLGEVTETIETYENESDFEDYEICDPTDVGYGRLYGPNGEDLGPWEPRLYTDPGEDPIRKEIEDYEQLVRTLARKPFWTTRTNRPTSITSSDPRVIPQVYNVTFPAWADFFNSHAISPILPSNVKGTDFGSVLFSFEWTEDFPVSGEYIFRGTADGAIKELYIDDVSVGTLSSYEQPPNLFQKTIEKGIHKIRIDLLNGNVEETVSENVIVESQTVGSLFIKEGDQYYILISGNDLVDIDFVFDWNNIDGNAVTRIIIPTEQGSSVILSRSTNRGSSRSTGTFRTNKKYGPILFEAKTNFTKSPEIVDTGPNPNQRQQRINLFSNVGNDITSRLTAIDARQLSANRYTNVTRKIVSSKSWNENPTGLALTIDAPQLPPPPQEQPPAQEGRCPNNPIWTTRFPGSAETWYPVRYTEGNLWSKFLNRYAISPVPPLDTPTSDTGGVLFKNSWDIDIPYDGFYKFLCEQDDVGKIYVDDQIAFDLSTADNDIWKDPTNKVKSQKVFITKGRHTIGVELENRKTETTTQINQKIFRTLDWQTGQVTGETAKDGVVYEGPSIIHHQDTRWSSYMNRNSISPLIPGPVSDNGRKIFTWKNVRFPENGQYDITFLADNNARLFINGVDVLGSQGFAENPQTFKVNISQGTYDIAVDSEYPYDSPQTNNQQYFNVENPTGFALEIRKNVSVIQPGSGKSWKENPMGIGAILIPPPCPRKIRGRGVVTDVIVNDPGNGYLRPIPQDQGYPVALRLKEVIVENPGINYSGNEQIEVPNGAVLEPVFGPFGTVQEVKVLNPGLGFTEYPNLRLISETGVNASFRPVFEVVRDPIVLPERLIQVTDLVGLKQTGYVDGRPYYGAVYYDQGVRYAGFYETVGDLVQVYDTLQESITAQVTTPASAIERSGTDVTSNDPRLNIPGTPQNLI
jgi:hypothetical protein